MRWEGTDYMVRAGCKNRSYDVTFAIEQTCMLCITWYASQCMPLFAVLAALQALLVKQLMVRQTGRRATNKKPAAWQLKALMCAFV